MSELQVCVVSPDSVLFEGPAAVGGRAGVGRKGRGILPRPRADDRASGLRGIVHRSSKAGGSERFFVAGGVLKVEDNDLIILTEYGGTEAPEELPAGAELDVGEILDAMESAG